MAASEVKRPFKLLKIKILNDRSRSEAEVKNAANQVSKGPESANCGLLSRDIRVSHCHSWSIGIVDCHATICQPAPTKT